MAGTADGRFLTDQHRRWQARLGAAMVGVTMDLSSLIDPEDIPGTFDKWLEQQVGVLEAVRIAGADEATQYMKAYRAAELGPVKAANLPIVGHVVDLRQDVDSVAWAPWTAQAAITAGQDPFDAWATVAKQLAWKTQNLALTPGRDVVWKSAEKAGGRWRRVSDGNPCSWCAMLVTRGPVYSKTTATTTQAGRSYHYACGCTAEEVFGEWQPTPQEQAYIDLYDAVHEPGDTAEQVTAKMRAYGQGVVHDAPADTMDSQSQKEKYHGPSVGASIAGYTPGTVNSGSGHRSEEGNPVGSGSGVGSAVSLVGGDGSRKNQGNTPYPRLDNPGVADLTIAGKNVQGVPTKRPAGYAQLENDGAPAPEFYELVRGKKSARAFHDAIANEQAKLKYGSAVDVHAVGQYKSMRLYVTADGLSGFALKKGDELVSVFSSVSGRGQAIVQQAVSQGAMRADCYAIPSSIHPEGYLPYLYAKGGFVEIARVDINEAFEYPPGSTHVAILGRIASGDIPGTKLYDKEGYFKAMEYRDRVVRSRQQN